MPTVHAAANINLGIRAVSVQRGLNVPTQELIASTGVVGSIDDSGSMRSALASVRGFSDFLAQYSDTKEKFENGLHKAIDNAKNAVSSLENLELINRKKSDLNNPLERASLREKQQEEKVALHPYMIRRDSLGTKISGISITEKQDTSNPKRNETTVQTDNVREKERNGVLGRVDDDSVVDKATKETVRQVEDFVNSYNKAAQYLENHQDVSEHVASLSSVFDDTSRSMQVLSDIGVTTDEKGALRVDAKRLGMSLMEHPENVKSALGTDGLAGRAARNIGLADFNRERLYPSVASVVSGEYDSSKFMYSKGAVTAANGFKNKGSIFNLYY